ncbi:hypothetical protein [Cyclobacterium sp.]|uniref:hypothetical protein n=1 Tax=Cyclobacterium sp. TaxID=1966343 RepID=UPI001984104A|nr:hypothetical protein [Cyclobacterium sp.]MBD3627587.1 hypothetical protein [Cyclobacterium sp.]
MSWARITNNCPKPRQWWMHKIFCEWGWIVRHRDNYKTYHHHLNMCCKFGFNLYGEPFKE